MMTTRLVTLPRTAEFKEVLRVLDSGLIAVVADDLGFHGLITRVDVLNHLRRHGKH